MKICILLMATVFLAVACFIDYKWKILPDWLTAVIAALGLFYCILSFSLPGHAASRAPVPPQFPTFAEDLSFQQHLLAALLCALAAFAVSCFLVLPGYMGFGDAKLFPALSLFFNGWQAFFSFYLMCFLMNGFICLVGLILQKLHKKSEVPMGPAIFLSFVLCRWFLF